MVWVLDVYKALPYINSLGLGNVRKVRTLKEIPKAYAVYGGKSVGANGWAGTVGYVARGGDKTYLVSNAHVVTNKPTGVGTDYSDIYSPSMIDGGKEVVGRYGGHVKIEVSKESSCPIGNFVSKVFNGVSKLLMRKTRLVPIVEYYNEVDLGWAFLNEGVEYMEKGVQVGEEMIGLDGRFIGLLFAGSEADGITLVCKARNMAKHGIPMPKYVDVGEETIVGKVGRTTGHTTGKVVATDVIMAVNYGVGIAYFKDVYLVESIASAFSKPGDSGSAVWVA